MGNAHQLTRLGRPAARAAWARHTLFAAGTGSLLMLSVLASLVLWTVLPWALLGWSPTVVMSGSMSPAVHTGDVVLLRPVSAGEVGEGTVVLHDDPDHGRVLHRVVERRLDGTYLLKGDANPTPDSSPASPARIRGAAVLRISWVGTPSVWLARGDLLAVAGAGVALLTCLRLVSYAFDPAFDPWAASRRVLPVQVLLAVGGGRTSAEPGPGLLPPELGAAVLAGLTEQAAATRDRYQQLTGALS